MSDRYLQFGVAFDNFSDLPKPFNKEIELSKNHLEKFGGRDLSAIVVSLSYSQEKKKYEAILSLDFGENQKDD